MKNTIIWVVQSNQITASIYEFMKIIRTRVERLINIEFMVPDSSSDIMKRIGDLEPTLFSNEIKGAKNSYQAFTAKQNELKQQCFPEGLSFSDVLLLDDFGGGNVQQVFTKITVPGDTTAVIIQIPTPLGSSLDEEKVFHAMVLWARQKGLPIIGYELLPLDTRWTLVPSLLDGVITRYPESFDYLNTVPELKNIRLLPLYEAALFSSTASPFQVSGAKASYHYRNLYHIPAQRPIFYIPHNVAMINEYQTLLRTILPVAKQVHLMFGYGKDQVRGSHTQKELIEIVYKNELARFASFSFHDMADSWETLMADSIIACASCFQTMIAREHNLPTLVYDPAMPPITSGFAKRVAQGNDLLQEIERLIERKKHTTEMAEVLLQLVNRKGIQ